MSDLKKCGFVEQKVSSATRTGKIDKVSGQIYTLDGYNLITTIDMENIEFVQMDDRVVAYDSNGKRVMNLSIYDMDGWAIKSYADNIEEHVFSIRNKGINCKVLVQGFDIKDAAS